MAELGSKKQILIIHGGDSFVSHSDYLKDLKSAKLDYDRLKPRRSWKQKIVDDFVDCDVLTPTMPNSANAQFNEWSIWFEKIIPFFGDDVRIIGHSLGAMFLIKYLHLHPLSRPVGQLHLVAAGYNDDIDGYGSFAIDSATGLDKSANSIYLYHSEDDFVVPFSELAKISKDIPSATVHSFVDRNHFLDEDFPELVDNLKK